MHELPELQVNWVLLRHYLWLQPISSKQKCPNAKDAIQFHAKVTIQFHQQNDAQLYQYTQLEVT